MKQVLWIGSTHSQKEWLVSTLLSLSRPLGRTMAMERIENWLLSPGEYIENPWYFSALLVTSYDVDTVLFVYRDGEPYQPYPPACGEAFNRRILGVFLYNDTSDIDSGRRLLEQSGANEVIAVHVHTLEGIEALRQEVMVES